ncbi:hypothetical protein N9291_01515 [bacterium]|nr:hypothetical protein [bacterium]
MALCSLKGETKPVSDQSDWEYTAAGASFSSGNSDSLAYSLQLSIIGSI